jgi:hypothetical protein
LTFLIRYQDSVSVIIVHRKSPVHIQAGLLYRQTTMDEVQRACTPGL